MRRVLRVAVGSCLVTIAWHGRGAQRWTYAAAGRTLIIDTGWAGA